MELSEPNVLFMCSFVPPEDFCFCLVVLKLNMLLYTVTVCLLNFICLGWKVY